MNSPLNTETAVVYMGSAGGSPDDQRRLAAVALAYRAGASAPQVVAKGRGVVAEEIIRRAQDAGIYVHQSRDLLGLLMQVDLDQHIPPQLYLAVAELLAWLYRVERGPQARPQPLPVPLRPAN